MTIFNDLLDVFRKAAGVDVRRPVLLDTFRGEYLYDDGQAKYSRLIPEYQRQVSSVESLAAVFKEEAKRRNNTNGLFMTVLFTERGGRFYPDDSTRLDEWKFERCLSQQWEYLQRRLDDDMSHRDFLRFLQGLRPSIVYYPEMMREFRKVRFDAGTSVTSQPILENGSAGMQVNLTLDTKNGETETTMPGVIELRMPFTRGGLQFYSITLELDVWLNDSNQVRIRPVCPEFEVIKEQALKDEVAFFQNEVETAGLAEALVALDY